MLALFLGGSGAHKFYLGQLFTGFVYLMFCWTFVPAFLGLIEFFVYLSHTDEAFAARHGFSCGRDEKFDAAQFRS